VTLKKANASYCLTSKLGTSYGFDKDRQLSYKKGCEEVCLRLSQKNLNTGYIHTVNQSGHVRPFKGLNKYQIWRESNKSKFECVRKHTDQQDYIFGYLCERLNENDKFSSVSALILGGLALGKK
jgi:hypothetical protein